MFLKNIEPVNLKKTAIISITKYGKKIANELKKFFPDSEWFFSSNKIPYCFEKYENIITIMAIGIVVRKIAPVIKSKSSDPAVVVIDELGKWVISLLSGHLGRANELAIFIAEKLNATPVITTATDIHNKFAIDKLPAKTGWEIENIEMIKKINLAILNEEVIAINVPKKLLEKFFNKKELSNFKIFKRTANLLKSKFKNKVLVSNSTKFNVSKNFLLIRPKNIYLGIGCNRGTKLEEIEEVVFSFLTKFKKSIKSINSISSFELKKNEKGLIEFANKYNIQLKFYNKDEINSVNEFYEPSEYLVKNIGVKGVCEPAAILSAKKDLCECLKRKTIIQKQKIGNVTIAIQELVFS